MDATHTHARLTFPPVSLPAANSNSFLYSYSMQSCSAHKLHPLVPLREDAGMFTLGFRFKVVGVALATTEPELSAGVSLGVVVPAYHVLPAGSRVQTLTTPHSWKINVALLIKG